MPSDLERNLRENLLVGIQVEFIRRIITDDSSAHHALFLHYMLTTVTEEFIELLGEFISTYTPEYDDDLRTYYYHFQIGTANKTNAYRCIATFIGDMGLTKAALATEKLVSKWKPDTIVLLGIAAALDNDVLLGDMVVPNQIDMYLENAKAVPLVGGEGYTFQLSGEVYRNSYDLRVLAEHGSILSCV